MLEGFFTCFHSPASTRLLLLSISPLPIPICPTSALLACICFLQDSVFLLLQQTEKFFPFVSLHHSPLTSSSSVPLIFFICKFWKQKEPEIWRKKKKQEVRGSYCGFFAYFVFVHFSTTGLKLGNMVQNSYLCIFLIMAIMPYKLDFFSPPNRPQHRISY